MAFDGIFQPSIFVPRRTSVRLRYGNPAFRVMDGNLSRALDILVSTIAILILLPVIALICLAIFLQDGGSPIFAHRRIGRGGKVFPCLKLRTMVTDSQERLQRLLDADPVARAEWALDQKLRNDPRITPLGAFLRKSSLDELPQLVNVLIGQMSLVGPRPIVAAEVARYGRYFACYCEVRPGITGLWQVSGRNNVSYQRRVAMDVLYTRKQGLLFNVRIILLTVPMVIFARGSY